MDPATTAVGTEILQWISQYGYIALLPLFIIEGPVVGVIAGGLVALGALNLLPVFLLYVSGTLISDTILYHLSRGGQRYLRKIPFGDWALDRTHHVVDTSSESWRHKFKENYFPIMVFTKLAPINLISEFVVLLAGILKIPPRKFYAPIFVAQPIWAAVIITIGYYSVGVIARPQKLFLEAGIVLVGTILLFLVYRRYMHTYLKKGILKQFFTDDEVDK